MTKKLTKTDKELIKMAENEIKQWQKFIKIIQTTKVKLPETYEKTNSIQKSTKGRIKGNFGTQLESIKHIGKKKDFPKNWGEIKVGKKLVNF